MPVARFVGTSELADKSNVLLKDISSSGQTCYITEHGKAKAVLMDIHRYHALMDLIEETEYYRDFSHARSDASVKAILNRYYKGQKA